MTDEQCPVCGKWTYDFHYGQFEPGHRFGGSEPDEGYCKSCGFHYVEHIDHPLEEQVKRFKVAKLVKDIEDWHIREKKKWAKGLLGKKKEYIDLENMEGRHNIDGHNQCRAEILKKIKEG